MAALIRFEMGEEESAGVEVDPTDEAPSNSAQHRVRHGPRALARATFLALQMPLQPARLVVAKRTSRALFLCLRLLSKRRLFVVLHRTRTAFVHLFWRLRWRRRIGEEAVGGLLKVEEESGAVVSFESATGTSGIVARSGPDDELTLLVVAGAFLAPVLRLPQ